MKQSLKAKQNLVKSPGTIKFFPKDSFQEKFVSENVMVTKIVILDHISKQDGAHFTNLVLREGSPTNHPLHSKKLR